MKLPKKQEQVIKMLIKEGMIDSKEQIVAIALFEYFRRLGYFDLAVDYLKHKKGGKR